MKAAIYARFSTDMQRDRSIEDQTAICRKHAERLGASVVAEFHDRARSGASIFGRTGLLDLMACAKAREFDVVIVEALDRLSRDQEDLAGIYKRLTFSGIRIEAVHDGQADAVQIGVRGMLGSLYLADLSHKTRRGLTGVVRDGRIAGGKAFGYRAVAGRPGAYEIVPEQAEVVRRIFADYLAGKSALRIATELNAERIEPPRGAIWRKNTISGHTARQNGILQNRLYVGEIVWNKTRYVRDPDTGRRTPRLNPESEWQTAEAPHLAIVDRVIFDAVNGRKRERSEARANANHDRPYIRKKHLLSGLLHCAECGAGMVIRSSYNGRARIQCSRAIEATVCSNRQKFMLDAIENAVVDQLAETLRTPDAMNVFLDEYFAEMNRLTSTARADREMLVRQKIEAEAQTSRMIDLVVRGVVPIDDGEKRLRELKETVARVSGELQAIDLEMPALAIEPEAIEEYRKAIDDLRSALSDPTARELAREAIHRLVGRIAIMGGDETRIEIHGKLAALVGSDLPPTLAFEAGSGTRFDRKSQPSVVPFVAQLISFGVFTLSYPQT